MLIKERRMAEQSADDLRLDPDAQTTEVIVARRDMEAILDNLHRTLSDEAKFNRIAGGVLENIGHEVHHHSDAMVLLLKLREAYGQLSEIRQSGEKSPLNPDFLDSGESSAGRESDKSLNIKFVNGCLDLPEVADVYGRIGERRGSDGEFADGQLDAIVVQSLIKRATPPALR